MDLLRPARADRNSVRRSSQETYRSEADESFYSVVSATSGGIPDALSFDKIISGGTCPPCTLRDFMNYLLYIEHSAENLQFFLWYRDYIKRFKSLSPSDHALAPKWSKELEEDATAKIIKEAYDALKRQPKCSEIFKGTDFDKKAGTKGLAPSISGIIDPFVTPPQTPMSGAGGISSLGEDEETVYRNLAGEAFDAVGIKRPFTIQPFRKEIDRVIATYIADRAPRQLNLSEREQKSTLYALAHTTHPSALRAAVKAAETCLRRQAHPNFIRWSICNGSPARVFFARLMSSLIIAAATLAAVLLSLSSVPRGYRALCAFFWFFGVAALVAAGKGLCILLHGLHHRHIRPWELFVDEEYERGQNADRSGGSFGNANSYEDEPWVIRYRKRNLVRKIFERQAWIEEPALKAIQDIIFLQAALFGLLVAGILVLIFMLVPSGGYF